MDLSELRRLREQAAHRRRRVIFNNDGCDIVYSLEGKEVCARSLLDDRTTGLVGTHVDSIFYVTWSGGLGHCTHMSDVAETFDATSGVFATNMTRQYHEAGLDPLQIMVDFGREHDIEIVWSMRMNDIHDADPRWTEMFPQFKKDHPQYLFGAPDEPPAFGRWSGLDYGEPEVRERAFRLLEDVCQRYDVDGIELDWMRHPPHFRCNTTGDDCTQAERDLMTDLMRRVRDMTEKAGLDRGRPLLVAVRVPGSVPCCDAVGLDVRRWLVDDLVDILVPAEWELAPWEAWVELGRPHGVPVYPSLTWSGSKKRQGPPDTPDGLASRHFRARAMNVWHAGADGVCSFNLFDPGSPLWREVGDPEVLSRLDQDYYPEGHFRFLLNTDFRDLLRFVELPTTLGPELPVQLEADRPFTVTMTIGEDLSAATPPPEVVLSVRVKGLTGAESLAVELNDSRLSEGRLAGDWVSYRVPAESIRCGANTVRITRRARSDAVILEDTHLRITRPPESVRRV